MQRLIALFLLLISMLLRALGLMLLGVNELPQTTPEPTAIVEAAQTSEPVVVVVPTPAPEGKSASGKSSSGKKSSGKSSRSKDDDDDSSSSGGASSWRPSRDEDTLPEVDVSDDGHDAYEGGDSSTDEDTLPEISVD